METKKYTWNVPFITFLNTWNTIKVHNKKEFNMVTDLLEKIGYTSTISWDKIKQHIINGYLCLEFDNAKGGITFYEDEKDSIEWYEAEPFSISDIFAEQD